MYQSLKFQQWFSVTMLILAHISQSCLVHIMEVLEKKLANQG